MQNGNCHQWWFLVSGDWWQWHPILNWMSFIRVVTTYAVAFEDKWISSTCQTLLWSEMKEFVFQRMQTPSMRCISLQQFQIPSITTGLEVIECHRNGSDRMEYQIRTQWGSKPFAFSLPFSLFLLQQAEGEDSKDELHIQLIPNVDFLLTKNFMESLAGSTFRVGDFRIGNDWERTGNSLYVFMIQWFYICLEFSDEWHSNHMTAALKCKNNNFMI